LPVREHAQETTTAAEKESIDRGKGMSSVKNRRERKRRNDRESLTEKRREREENSPQKACNPF
jgi:hypothetical protein